MPTTTNEPRAGHPRTTGKSRRLAREQRAERGERVPGDPVPFRRADASMRPRRRRHGATRHGQPRTPSAEQQRREHLEARRDEAAHAEYAFDKDLTEAYDAARRT